MRRCAPNSISTRLGRAAAKFDEAQLRHWQKEAVAHLSAEEFQQWIADRAAGGTRCAQSSARSARPCATTSSCRADATLWVDVVFGKLPSSRRGRCARFAKRATQFFAAALRACSPRPAWISSRRRREIGQQTGRKGPALFMPLRAALTGVTHGPELAPLLALIPAD